MRSLKPLWADVNKHLQADLNDVQEQENESLWLDEAGRRYKAYKAGSLSARNAFEAITEMRSRL